MCVLANVIDCTVTIATVWVFLFFLFFLDGRLWGLSQLCMHATWVLSLFMSASLLFSVREKELITW